MASVNRNSQIIIHYPFIDVLCSFSSDFCSFKIIVMIFPELTIFICFIIFCRILWRIVPIFHRSYRFTATAFTSFKIGICHRCLTLFNICNTTDVYICLNNRNHKDGIVLFGMNISGIMTSLNVGISPKCTCDTACISRNSRTDCDIVYRIKRYVCCTETIYNPCFSISCIHTTDNSSGINGFSSKSADCDIIIISDNAFL